MRCRPGYAFLLTLALLGSHAAAEEPPVFTEEFAPADEPPAPAQEPPAPADELLERLALIPGLTFVWEQPVPVPGFRFLILSYAQPVDHDDPSRGTFEQTLTLLHHDFEAPMVAYTTGYEVPQQPFRSEVAALIDGNQVGIEERFFASSRPEPADWSALNIYQAAADHHRVIEALRPLYAGRWISTGASKGGMATVYHRRFFEHDVDASVAYVAPNDVVDSEDHYAEFLDHVGSDPTCRANLRRLQRQALLTRDEVLPAFEEYAAWQGCSFDIVGSADVSYELAVVNLYWTFWQYGSQALCETVPPADAYPYEIIDFVDSLGGLLSGCDSGLIGDGLPYVYQAATQLGYPDDTARPLQDLLRYPDSHTPRAWLPEELRAPFDPLAMADIDHWVRNSGHELMFIYGENDPWGAERFELGDGTHDAFSFTAPEANHGASIALLGASDQVSAANTVRRWAGLAPFERRRARSLEFDPNPVIDALLATPLDGHDASFLRHPL